MIGARALETGLVTGERLGRMSPPEIVHLVFRPGLSTAASVTRVSGRGVGLDVVRSHVGKVGGTVEVASHVGRGTSFRISIPLTRV